MNKKTVKIIGGEEAKKMFNNAPGKKAPSGQNKIIEVIKNNLTNEIVSTVEIDIETKERKILFQNDTDEQVKFNKRML